MTDVRDIEIAFTCLEHPTTELCELVDLAQYCWPDEPENTVAAAALSAARWLLAHGYATLDAGTFSEPAPVAPYDHEATLRDAANWQDGAEMRMFLRPTSKGQNLHADHDAWPHGYRERIDREAAAVLAVSLDRLASELVVRLVTHCPPGHLLEAVGPVIRHRHGPDGSEAKPWGCDWDLRDMREQFGYHEWTFLNIVRTILTDVQQEFTEANAMPWPTNAPSHRGVVFAEPEVRQTADAIELWFGPEDSPALRLPEIPMRAIAE